jgi:anti-anti-sigma regulatory factor
MMSITISQAQGKTHVTVLAIQGDLDAKNFREVIAKAGEAYKAGARCLLIDMSEMPFMSSSGLVALHSAILLFQGQQPADLEHGWEAFHAIDRALDSGIQKYVKLLTPQPRVCHTLEVTGMERFFEIYTDREAAVASFD